MRPRIALAAATLALFAVLATFGAVGWVFARQAPRGGLDAVPRASVAAFGVSIGALEAWAPTRALMTDVLGLPALQRSAVALRAACRTDPLTQVDSLVFALGRERTPAGDSEFEIVLQGPLRPPSGLIPCLDAVAGQLGTLHLERQRAVRGHETWALRSAAGTHDDAPWLALARDAVVLGDPAPLARTLEVLDDRAPGANQNDRLRGALGDVSGALLWAAVDARAANSAGGADANALLGALVPLDAALGALLQAPSLESASAGVLRTTAGVRVAFALRYLHDDDAAASRTVVAQRLDAVRSQGTLAAALTSSEALYLARVAAAQATEPSLAPRARVLQQAFGLINALPDRVVVRTAGPTVRVELELTGADVATLIEGAHAAVECQFAFDRTAAPTILAP